jgi:hypothetical protein
MNPTPLSVDEAIHTFDALSARLLGLYQNRPADIPSQPPPGQWLEGIGQFLGIARELERREPEEVSADEVSEVGDYGLSLLGELQAWVIQAQLRDALQEVHGLVAAVAGWIVRQGARIQTLEPVVDALAGQANATTDPSELRRLAAAMEAVVGACTPTIRNDLERHNPARPWRILHLNWAITATRSRDTALMERVFDTLVATLPEEAPRFFREGMGEMVRLDYPASVRTVMQRYFERWSEGRMN